MSCTIHPAGPEASRPRTMTRCECAEVSFQEIAGRMVAGGETFEEATRQTGCGQTCTACLPDLRAYLRALSTR
ncbi:MAG TPA: (2Fe-2S)-binding protein [Vicinamibacteria bacterium]|jgi:bacterioferritin-associated ferredoxin